MKIFFVVIFAAMCAFQWYVPGSMILEQEHILRSGRIFRFKTAPVDPSDPFRGKYITLNFEGDSFKNSQEKDWVVGENVFVVLSENEDGYARIIDLTDFPPGPDDNYFQAAVASRSGGSVRVNFPFDRFYLEESKASEAERLYWESSGDSTQTAYALVRIKDGKTVLEDVILNDRSIVEIVRELNRDE